MVLQTATQVMVVLYVFTDPFAHPYCAFPLIIQTTLVFYLENF